MSDALLPCPSGKNHPEIYTLVPSGGSQVLCDCGWSGPAMKTETEAIAAWNRRAEPHQGDTELHTGWMSVDERLPDDSVTVLLHPNRALGYYCQGLWWLPDEEYPLLKGDDPTHWMPLPEPPKVNDDT